MSQSNVSETATRCQRCRRHPSHCQNSQAACGKSTCSNFGLSIKDVLQARRESGNFFVYILICNLSRSCRIKFCHSGIPWILMLQHFTSSPYVSLLFWSPGLPQPGVNMVKGNTSRVNAEFGCLGAHFQPTFRNNLASVGATPAGCHPGRVGQHSHYMREGHVGRAIWDVQIIWL